MIEPIEKVIPQIVKALLEISKWPWDPDDDLGFILSSNLGIAHVGGVEKEASTEVTDSERLEYKANLMLIASSPLWLARMVVGIIEKEADLCNISHYEINGQMGGHSCTKGALSRFSISPSDYEELKRRVEG